MLKNFYPALFWTIIITGLSISPGLPVVDWNFISFDKAAHFVVYGILAWLICFGFYSSNRISLISYITAFVFSASWGMLMEWVQGTFFPYRFFEWPDEVANIIGAFLGLFAFAFWKTKKAQLIENQRVAPK